jgi:hypothetical protein
MYLLTKRAGGMTQRDQRPGRKPGLGVQRASYAAPWMARMYLLTERAGGMTHGDQRSAKDGWAEGC